MGEIAQLTALVWDLVLVFGAIVGLLVALTALEPRNPSSHDTERDDSDA